MSEALGSNIPTFLELLVPYIRDLPDAETKDEIYIAQPQALLNSRYSV